jgi:hypothetical protein
MADHRRQAQFIALSRRGFESRSSCLYFGFILNGRHARPNRGFPVRSHPSIAPRKQKLGGPLDIGDGVAPADLVGRDVNGRREPVQGHGDGYAAPVNWFHYTPASSFDYAARDLYQPPIRQRSLQCLGLLSWRRHRQEGEKVRRLCLRLDLPRRGPLRRPDSGEIRQRPIRQELEPHILPCAVVNSENEVSGTTQRLPTPRHGRQWLLEVLRTCVVPPSGSILSSSFEINSLPFARSLSARFIAA